MVCLVFIYLGYISCNRHIVTHPLDGSMYQYGLLSIYLSAIHFLQPAHCVSSFRWKYVSVWFAKYLFTCDTSPATSTLCLILSGGSICQNGLLNFIYLVYISCNQHIVSHPLDGSMYQYGLLSIYLPAIHLLQPAHCVSSFRWKYVSVWFANYLFTCDTSPATSTLCLIL